MAGIFLGANEIKYNGNPVGNMRVGGTNICKGYVGSVLVFDNCAQANSNVQLQLDLNNLNASPAGYSITGDTTGTTKSGQPNAAYSKFTTNIAAIGNYTWTSGPTVNDAPAGTFPSTPGSTTIVTTTITGTLQAPVGTVNSSISYNTSGITGWTSSAGTISPTAPATISGAVGSIREWNVSVTLNQGWQIDQAITGTGIQGGVFPATNNTTYTAILGGQVSQTQYTYQWNFSENLTGATASYDVDGTASTFSSSAGPISVSGTLNQTSTATISGSPSGSNVWQGSDPSYSNGSSQQITFGPLTNGGSQTLGITGTASAPVSTISLYDYNGSCANDSCISKGSAALTTFYYYGTNENSAVLYRTNTNGTLSGSVSTGYYAKSGGGSFHYTAGSNSSTNCYNVLYYTNVAIGGAPCGNPINSPYYLDTQSFATVSYFDSGGGSVLPYDGCDPVGSGFFNNGISWVEVSNGVVVSGGSC